MVFPSQIPGLTDLMEAQTYIWLTNLKIVNLRKNVKL